MRERSALCMHLAFAVLIFTGLPLRAWSQANYEIQVYGAETVPPQNLMVELHSNFTARGEKDTVDGVYPTNHQEHETLELTEGLNEWAEVGFYVFTSEQDGYGAQWVFVVTDLNVSPVWEINFGVGIGATASTDHLIFKAILGRRIDWGRHSAVD
jgi:hypothetical protein